MVTPDGSVKIIDFDLAMKNQGKLSAGIGLMGTPDYLPPEIYGARDGQVFDSKVDSYASGVMFNHLLGNTLVDFGFKVDPFSENTVFAKKKLLTDPAEGGHPTVEMLVAELNKKNFDDSLNVDFKDPVIADKTFGILARMMDQNTDRRLSAASALKELEVLTKK
ncbi:MAG: hypothetical protein G01um101418_699 [Parcubacteria group bacterium Gr01-1014_18]|nr:MAG: hypothetical protein Greene041636_847 [Parcubacteria group bacterium Greene0416_36]TSC80280.1 MAG: hypothetical protein G01um101418_699 [Parcubacteria group bacterium Gr01-1014_18]TSC98259.1 MAG: hypothetical protein Greene101420_852 [Parcubacteria group bacterium Greene1014_20]TSD06998.1 MAG: hypothetical protein Greene07142_455 [Parcubacteria group bacterium Greene0714_2]